MKTFKHIITTLFIIFLIAFVLYNENHYHANAIVISKSGNIYTLKDDTHNYYTLESKEDIELHTIINATFNTNNTDNTREDDYITSFSIIGIDNTTTNSLQPTITISKSITY